MSEVKFNGIWLSKTVLDIADLNIKEKIILALAINLYSEKEHLSIEKNKEVTNYKNTKKLLNNINLEFPETPDIKDIKKLMINRDEKIENEIIKTKDELIQELYKDNLLLHKELSKQSNLIEKAEKYEKEGDLLAKNT